MTDKATTPPITGAELDLSKLAEIANRVQARGLFNASCDILDWIQEVHTAQARAQQESAAAPAPDNALLARGTAVVARLYNETPNVKDAVEAGDVIQWFMRYAIEGRKQGASPHPLTEYLMDNFSIGQENAEGHATNIMRKVAAVAPSDVMIERASTISNLNSMTRFDAAMSEAEVVAKFAAVAPSDATGKADLLDALQKAARLLRAAGFCMTGTATSQIVAAINAHSSAKGKADAANAGGMDAVLSADSVYALADEYCNGRAAVSGAYLFKPIALTKFAAAIQSAKSPATSAADAKDAARYRVLRQNVKPGDVSIIMTAIPPAGQSSAERIDMLCDGFIDRAAIAATQQGGQS